VANSPIFNIQQVVEDPHLKERDTLSKSTIPSSAGQGCGFALQTIQDPGTDRPHLSPGGGAQ